MRNIDELLKDALHIQTMMVLTLYQLRQVMIQECWVGGRDCLVKGK